MKRAVPLVIALCVIIALGAEVVRLRRQAATPAPVHRLPTGAHRSGITPEVERELQRIATLGYVAGSEPAPQTTGVLRHDPEASLDGLTLYTCAEGPEAFLIDMGGNVVHSWSVPGSVYWARARAFPNGDLLVIACNPPHILKLSRDSEVLWRYEENVHHDFAILDDGSIWVLVEEAVSRPDILGGAPVLDDHVVVLDANGREVDRMSLLDAFERSEQELGWLSGHPFPDDGDIFHTNSIEVHSRGEQTRILLSIRSIHTIALLDAGDRKIIWAMDGPWHKQHEAQFVDGNLLLFDNLGLTKALGNSGQSRVLEIDPRSHELVWSYTEPGFFSHGVGAQQRLPNGNTLITESIKGRIIEVTPDGRVVWEYVNPLTVESDPNLVLAILRAERLAPGFPLDWVVGAVGRSLGT